jgi:hypothetical protein
MYSNENWEKNLVHLVQKKVMGSQPYDASTNLGFCDRTRNRTLTTRKQ